MAKELAYLSPAAGISTATLQLQAITSFTVADTWHCIFSPVASQAVPTFRTLGQHRHARGHVHTYTWAHGTDSISAVQIFRAMLVRRIVPGSGSGQEGEFPPCCFYGQSALGELELHTAQKACDTELRMTKGLQGTVAYKIHCRIRLKKPA